MPPWLTGGFDVFVEEVVPILRKRGLFRTEYTGSTLRDHYGLDRPAEPVHHPPLLEGDRMTYRNLGTTGVKVSPLTLGAMMFGGWGNPDHDECVRIIHRALDSGINVIDTADVYARGESEEIVGKALKGRRDDVVLATKFHGAMSDDDPNHGGNSRRWIVREVERLAAPAADRPHRPLPGAPAPAGDRHRRHALGAVGPGPPGQGPLHRYVDVPAVAGRRGAVGGRAPPSRATGDRAAAVLDPGPRGRARHPPDGPALRPRHPAVEPAGRRAGSPGATAAARRRRVSSRQQRQPARHDPTRPENAPSWRPSTRSRTWPTRRDCR